MKPYKILYRESKATDVDWVQVPHAYISHYLWETNGYQPPAFGQLAWSSKALLVHLWCGEQHPLVTYHQWNQPIYEDSCLEFFVNLTPCNGSSFFNFEMNAEGVLLAEFGNAGQPRTSLLEKEWKGRMAISAFVNSLGGWEITYELPWELLRRYQPDFSPQPEWVITGNFFKCGNSTAFPHYGAWNPIDLPDINFHRPEFFVPCIFVK